MTLLHPLQRAPVVRPAAPVRRAPLRAHGDLAQALNGSPRVVQQAALGRALSRGAGGSAPVQLVPGGTRFSWAVWARGGGSTKDDGDLAAIAGALDRYHRGRERFRSDQAFSDHRAAALDDAQRGVHRYLDGLGDLSQGSLSRDYMLDLMDELQQAHIEHTDYVHRNDLDLYSAVPLGRRGRWELDRAWDEVRGGTGAVRLPLGPGNEADNRATRAAFARLMSRPTGSHLVSALLDQSRGPWQLNVSYTNRLDPDEQARRERNAADYDDARLRYEALMRAGAGEDQVGPAYQALMPFMDATWPGYRDVQANEPAAASKPSGMRILRGLRDSETLNHRGVRTGLIPGPAHIVLGHELVHALHYKRGEDDPGNPDDYARGTPLHHWKNAEERRTIAAGPGPTENLLRAEHDLPARVGHTSVARRDLPREDTRLLNRGMNAAATAALLLAASYARAPLGAEME